VPDRLLAVNQVRIDSPQMTGAVARLEGWFERESPVGVAHRVNYPGEIVLAQSQVPSDAPSQYDLPAPQPMPLPQPHELPMPETRGAAPAPLPMPGTTASPLVAGQQYHVDGELLRMQIALVDKVMQVREVMVEQNVHLQEIRTKNPGDQPLDIRGNTLHLIQPNPEQSHVTVTGVPAQVAGGGMTIAGGKLTLDRPNRTTNNITVEGQGVLTMPVDKDMQGRPTATPDVLHLSWQGGMTFDGTTAVFQRGVEGIMSSQYLRTDRLHVVFSKPIGVDRPAGEQKPEIAHVDCYDGVFIESRTAASDGSPATIDRIESRTLSLDQKSGDFSGDGPGEVVSIRRSSGNAPGGAPNAGPANAGVAARPANFAAAPGNDPPAGEQPINYLQVRFQRSISGNHGRREMTFQNQVRALYGPVPNWNSKIDPDRPAKWHQQTVMVDCDRMQVFGRTNPAGGGDTYDLVAEGNTLVEGTSFTARSPRLTYAQAKDLLVIEGDNRTDAVLFHQEKTGQETSGTTAKRFMVWPSTKRVQVDGVTTIDLRPN
jgi:hypothetical protein